MNLDHTYRLTATMCILIFLCQNVFGQDTNMIIASKSEGCAPFSVNFSYSDANVKGYAWEFSNGSISTISEPTVLFKDPGEYDAKLTITLKDNSSKTIVQKGIVAVGDLPSIVFSASVVQMCLGDTLSLTNQSVNATSYLWDFGDGINSNEKEPKHIYKDAGEYTITLVAFNNYGCSNIKLTDHAIKVYESTNLSFTTDKNTICENDPEVSFKSTDGLSEYYWDFGDNTTSTENNPVHQYQKEGQYSVKLNAVDINGCKSAYINSNPLSYHPMQKISVSLSDSIICLNQSVEITNHTTKTDSIAWMIDDTYISSQNEFTHLFETTGNHKLTLFHQDQFGCIQKLQNAKSIDVLIADPIDVQVSSFEGCAPMQVRFTNSTSDATHSVWHIGDSIFNSDSFDYTFMTADTISVQANTTHASGCVTSFTFDKPIVVHQQDIRSTVTNASGCAPLETSFHLSSDKVSNVLWDFGNGLSSSEKNPTITYTEAGNYSPSVSLTNEFGCSETLDLATTVLVYDPMIDYNPPKPIHICPYEEVLFSGEMGKGEWEWDFGDGDISKEKNPKHQFTTPGTYVVSLKTTNKFGCSVTIENYNEIVVSNVTPPNFNYIVMDCSQDNIVDFMATESENLSYAWSLGDGTTVEGSKFSHNYPSEGYYQIQLTASDNFGCSAISSRNILVDFRTLDCAALDTSTLTGGGDVIITEAEIPKQHQPMLEVCSAPFEMSFDKPGTNAVAWLWDFKDGTTSTKPDPDHTFWFPGTFDIDLYLTRENGKIDTLNGFIKIIVGSKKLDFEYANIAFCDSSRIEIQNTTEDAMHCNWDFGDGGSSMITNPMKNYASPGIYQVSLASQDSMGCLARTVHNIAVGNPYINISVPGKICFEDSITVNHNIDGFSEYNWSFGDGTQSSEKYPNHQFQEPGKYNINLELTDQNNCKTTYDSLALVEVIRPEALFSIKGKTTGCNKLEVKFANLSKGAQSYLWDFGDGRTSTVEHPIVKFGVGTYTISLTATNGGCVDKYIMTNAVQVYELIASYSIEQDDICLPVQVDFKDASTNATEWKWSFGDGSISTERNPTHIFHQKPGKKVTLQVKNQYGCNAQIVIDSVKIHKTEFSVKNKNGCIPFKADFSDKSTDGKNWYWDFGNGEISYEKNPSTIYNEQGTYTVSLITTSTTGCKDTATVVDLMQTGYLENDFSVTFPPSMCSPLSASFDNHSVGADSYMWDFGDGATSSLQNPNHIYTKVGEFDVSLIAQNKLGCIDTVLYLDLVKTLGPQAEFSISDSIVCYPAEIKITNKSVSAIKWEWIISDGNSYDVPNPSHRFKETGNYSIALLATDKFGCIELAIKDSIKVVKVPKTLFAVEDFSYCQPASIAFQNQSQDLHHADFYWDFGNQKVSREKEPVLTFSEPGSYTVSLVTVNEGTCSNTYTLPSPIHIKDTSQLKEPDILQLTVKDDQAIQIRMNPYQRNNLNYHLVYRKAFLDDVFQLTDTIKDPLTTLYVDNNVQPQEMQYSYKIQSNVSCNSPVAISELNTYTSILLKSQTEDKNIKVDWSHYGGHNHENYSVLRTSKNDNWSEIVKVDHSINNYLDEEELCPFDYTYKLVANNLEGKNYISESNTTTVSPKYNIFEKQHVEIIRSTVVDNHLVLTEWFDPEIGADKVVSYEIHKSSDGGNSFNFINSVPAGINSWLDSDVQTDAQHYQYKISVINTCDVMGMISNLGTSILLQKETNQYQNTLFWTPYEGWKEGVEEYQIQEKNEYGEWETIEIVAPEQNSILIDLSED